MIEGVAAVAAAVAPPAFYAVRAAPRCVLVYSYLVLRRVLLKVLRVVGQAGKPLSFDRADRISEGHITKVGVVTESLAICRNVHQLRVLALIIEPGHKAMDKPVAALQKTIK